MDHTMAMVFELGYVQTTNRPQQKNAGESLAISTLLKGFIRINKMQEKLIYLYCLSANYNNRSLAAAH
jgi:hypothetical protein